MYVDTLLLTLIGKKCTKSNGVRAVPNIGQFLCDETNRCSYRTVTCPGGQSANCSINCAGEATGELAGTAQKVDSCWYSRFESTDDSNMDTFSLMCTSPGSCNYASVVLDTNSITSIDIKCSAIVWCLDYLCVHSKQSKCSLNDNLCTVGVSRNEHTN